MTGHLKRCNVKSYTHTRSNSKGVPSKPAYNLPKSKKGRKTSKPTSVPVDPTVELRKFGVERLEAYRGATTAKTNKYLKNAIESVITSASVEMEEVSNREEVDGLWMSVRNDLTKLTRLVPQIEFNDDEEMEFEKKVEKGKIIKSKNDSLIEAAAL